MTELQPPSTEVRPLVRFRPAPSQVQVQTSPGGVNPAHAPSSVCVAFLSSASGSLPGILLPHSPPSTSPLARASLKAQTNFQDMLVFDRAAGTLTLFRVTTHSEMGIGIGVGGMNVGGGVSMGGERVLHGAESTVATWRLGRGRDWAEVREVVHEERRSEPVISTASSESKCVVYFLSLPVRSTS